MDVETFKKNFGGYVLSLVVVLLVYSAVDIWAPKYSNYFAIITLMGIVMFYFKNK
jgi:type IV secretory pathway TrbL component